MILRPKYFCFLGIITFVVFNPGSRAAYGAYTTEDIRKLTGAVVQQEDSSAIPNAHVINITMKTGVPSGSDGIFAINIRQGDSLYFQAIGFESRTVYVSEEFFNRPGNVIIVLEKMVYDITGIDIYLLPRSYEEFKQRFINLDTLPDYSNLLDSPARALPDEHPTGVPIFSPVTFFYNLFSREGKELRKYKETLEREALARRIEKVLNHDVVRNLTGLEDEDEIMHFLSFCGLSVQFILDSKEYEVYETILDCYERYKDVKPE
ncbi:MAG: carboxypeptidase regulatory-like domain-containing protein [Marinilabiliales bacterium]|nr:MAG: carboxypeptidase regulatory-like domain-containing protein [Marinilabiliales bacterium]